MPKPKRPKVNQNVIDVLENALVGARNGEMTDIYLVYKDQDNEFQELYHTDDIDEMIYGVRTTTLLAKLASERIREAAKKRDEE